MTFGSKGYPVPPSGYPGAPTGYPVPPGSHPAPPVGYPAPPVDYPVPPASYPAPPAPDSGSPDPWIGHPDATHVGPAYGRQSDMAEVGAAARLTLRHYIRMWRRYRVLVISMVILTVAGSGVRLLVLTPKTYAAKATILPSGSGGSSGVLGLIANFTGGAPMVGGGDESSSALFPRILQSREVGVPVLSATYEFKDGATTTKTTLLEFLQAKNLDEGLKALDAIRAVDVDKETGLITVSVVTPFPDLSAQIANRSVDALEEFNKDLRHAGASSNSTFIRERLEQSLKELTVSEEKLTEFKEQNLRINDPQLELERLRLERDATLKSQVYMTLSNQAVLARIEETKNIPVVRVLDHAAVPAIPQPVPIVATAVGGAILGFVLALLFVAGLEFWQHLRVELRAA